MNEQKKNDNGKRASYIFFFILLLFYYYYMCSGNNTVYIYELLRNNNVSVSDDVWFVDFSLVLNLSLSKKWKYKLKEITTTTTTASCCSILRNIAGCNVTNDEKRGNLLRLFFFFSSIAFFKNIPHRRIALLCELQSHARRFKCFVLAVMYASMHISAQHFDYIFVRALMPLSKNAMFVLVDIMLIK